MVKKILIETIIHLIFWLGATYYFINNSFLRYPFSNEFFEYLENLKNNNIKNNKLDQGISKLIMNFK